jgi:hypothetical protein
VRIIVADLTPKGYHNGRLHLLIQNNTDDSVREETLAMDLTPLSKISNQHTSECTRKRPLQKLPTSSPSPGAKLSQRSTQTRSPRPSGTTSVTAALLKVTQLSASLMVSIAAKASLTCKRCASNHARTTGSSCLCG